MSILFVDVTIVYRHLSRAPSLPTRCFSALASRFGEYLSDLLVFLSTNLIYIRQLEYQLTTLVSRIIMKTRHHHML